jgi:hypothetical protein
MAGDLAFHQRALCALILDLPGEPAPADAYLRRVAGSDALGVVHDIAASWRAYTFGRGCPLTWRALAVRGGLDDALRRLMRNPGASPYLVPRALAFLDSCGRSGDALVAAVARFEHSVLQAGTLPGSRLSGEVVIDWPCDPVVLIGALSTLTPGQALPAGDGRTYRSRADARHPARLAVQPMASVLLGDRPA